MLRVVFFPFFLLCNLISNGQPSVPFSSCSSANVLIYKDGINCSGNAYNFYTLDLTGTLTSFGSPTALGEEINAISVSPTDNFLYGLQYTRTGIGNPCTFSNTRLIRMDAAGTTEDLGTITPPAGGTISNAFGTISTNGKYLFLATVGSNLFIGIIINVETLTTSASIAATYIPITNNCPGKSIADWAISPLDGNLYSYATYPETVGPTTFMRSVMVKIDLSTNSLDCIGAINTTELLDPLRDNFGGVMFGSDNNIYAVNINTRKFYKIDPITGVLSFVSTFAGSGNMRADLGSCITAPVVLPVKISDFSIKTIDCKDILNWKIEESNEIKTQIILQSYDGINFNEIKTFQEKNTSHFIMPNKVSCYYRLKFVEFDGSITHSDIKFVKNKCSEASKLSILGNPVINQLVAQYNYTEKISGVEILDAIGKKIKVDNPSIEYNTGKIIINTSGITAGIYYIKITNKQGEIFVKSFTKL